MSGFSSTQFEFLQHLARTFKEITEDTIDLERGTLRITVTKCSDGCYAVSCKDEDCVIQIGDHDFDLETTVKKAFQGYMEKSAAVRQTRQFILNAEEGIKEFHKKTGKYAI